MCVCNVNKITLEEAINWKKGRKYTEGVGLEDKGEWKEYRTMKTCMKFSKN